MNLGKLKSAFWMLLIPAVSPIYDYLNHSQTTVYSLVTDLDRAIPFVPQFIVPYLAWYLFTVIMLLWFLAKDKRIYFAALAAILLSLLVSFTVYSTFQTTVPRPQVLETDIFSRLTSMMYNSDRPYNAFPSIHVAVSYIIFLASSEAKPFSLSVTLAAQGFALLIIISTLMLKQHVLLDVAGGMLLGTLALRFVQAIIGNHNKEAAVWLGKQSLLSMTNAKSQS